MRTNGAHSLSIIALIALYSLQPPSAFAQTLYGISLSQQTLITIDRQSGATTTVGPLGVDSMEGLAYDSIRDTLFGVSYDNNLYSINRMTGAASLVGPLGVRVQFPGLDFDPNTGTLYMTTIAPDQFGVFTSSLYGVNPLNGAASKIGNITGNTIIDGLAFNSVANALYAVSSATYLIYSMNTANASLTQIAGVGIPLIYTEAAYDSGSGNLYWTDAGRSSLYFRNMTSGTMGLVGTSPGLLEVRGLAFAPIPEPSSLCIALLGLIFILRPLREVATGNHSRPAERGERRREGILNWNRTTLPDRI